MAMNRLDLFSAASGKRRTTGPFDGVQQAEAWFAQLVNERGALVNDALCETVAKFSQDEAQEALNADALAALLQLNTLSQPQQFQLETQYLMSVRMPKVLETQLRGQILRYGQAFYAAYARFLSPDFAPDEMARLQPLLPQALARMLHYLAQHALWAYFRHFSPEPGFWARANQLYRQAEGRGIDSVSLVLFDGQSGTTIQDQYLALQLVSLVASGNLQPRQINAAYHLALLLSNRTALETEAREDSSFMVDLGQDMSAMRPSLAAIKASTARFWSMAEIHELLNAWSIVFESGRMPEQLRQLNTPGLDGVLLHYLLREWSVKPFHFERADRIPVGGKSIEVAHRLALLHRLIRAPDEERLAKNEVSSFDGAGELRIYGFVTSRSRNRSFATPAPVVTEPKEALPTWFVENQSTTGLGVSLDALGNDWVTLGGLLGYREGAQAPWSMGIVRRIKRPAQDKLYLGIEILSERPVAASLRGEDGRALLPQPQTALPPERLWQGGEIALFVPCAREGRKVNAMVLAVSSYALGKQQYMSARGKHFLIALGKVLEKGSDWCLCEIELIRAVEALPKT